MNFKVFLAEKQIKQVDIARKLNVDPPTVSDWVRQVRPVPKTMKGKLARALGTNIKAVEAMTK